MTPDPRLKPGPHWRVISAPHWVKGYTQNATCTSASFTCKWTSEKYDSGAANELNMSPERSFSRQILAIKIRKLVYFTKLFALPSTFLFRFSFLLQINCCRRCLCCWWWWCREVAIVSVNALISGSGRHSIVVVILCDNNNNCELIFSNFPGRGNYGNEQHIIGQTNRVYT